MSVSVSKIKLGSLESLQFGVGCKVPSVRKGSLDAQHLGRRRLRRTHEDVDADLGRAGSGADLDTRFPRGETKREGQLAGRWAKGFAKGGSQLGHAGVKRKVLAVAKAAEASELEHNQKGNRWRRGAREKREAALARARAL